MKGNTNKVGSEHNRCPNCDYQGTDFISWGFPDKQGSFRKCPQCDNIFPAAQGDPVQIGEYDDPHGPLHKPWYPPGYRSAVKKFDWAAKLGIEDERFMHPEKPPQVTQKPQTGEGLPPDAIDRIVDQIREDFWRSKSDELAGFDPSMLPEWDEQWQKFKTALIQKLG